MQPFFCLRLDECNFVRKKLARGGKKCRVELLLFVTQISVWHTNEAAFSGSKVKISNPGGDEKGLASFGPAQPNF